MILNDEILNNHEYWELSKYPAAFYRLLGIVFSSYAGSCNLNNNIIQQYAKEYYNKDFIDWIIKQVEKTASILLSNSKLPNDLIIEHTIDESKNINFIKIKSKNICQYLRYINFGEISDLFISLFKPTIGTYPLALLQRLEFICGSYIEAYRGNDAEWIFYNNFDKFKLIYQYMVELANDNDLITSSSRFAAPNTHRLTLNTDGNLWKTIKDRLNNSNNYIINHTFTIH